MDGGFSLEANTAPDQAALSGETATYGSQTAFSGSNPLSALVSSQYVSRRTPTGWVTEAITPRQELEDGRVNLSSESVQYSPFQGFNPNLEDAYLAAGNPAPVEGAPAGYDMPLRPQQCHRTVYVARSRHAAGGRTGHRHLLQRTPNRAGRHVHRWKPHNL